MSVFHLDCVGLKCPMPVLRLKRALGEAPAGSRFVVACTDPMAAIDIPNLLRESGDRLEATERSENVMRFIVVKQ